jgi:hypothetical protein
LQTKLIPALLAPAVLLALAAPALAGNGNTLYLVQDSPRGTTDGNNFLSDQTLANYSSIGTNSSPALQSGTGNKADITIRNNCLSQPLDGSCGLLMFRQDNTGADLGGVLTTVPTTLLPNQATVTIAGIGDGSIQQIGGRNVATLNVENGAGTISQKGLDNTATLTLDGAANGSIQQQGIGNSGGLHVTSLGGEGHLTQTGTGLDAGTITVATTSDVQIYTFSN